MLLNLRSNKIKNLSVEWSCPWFDVIKFDYVKQVHYRIRTPAPGVSAIVIRKDGKFVMVRQTRPFFDQPKLEVINGGVEKKETPLQALRREVSEETGYEVLSAKLLLRLSPYPARSTNFVYAYVVRVDNRPAHAPEEKDLPDATVVALTLSQLMRAIKRGESNWTTVAILLYYLRFGK
jgi:8-oxo-dGTP pyrophosphatase MutT (NUDIX family)